MCDFAKIAKGADIDKLADAIIETKSLHKMYEFAKCIKGISAEKKDTIMKIVSYNDRRYGANEEARTLWLLLWLVDHKDFKTILDNKEEFSNLFVDKEQVASKEQQKMLIKSK